MLAANAATRCAGCEEYFCESCLEEDVEVEESFCSNCRRRCENCERVVGLPHCNEATGLCRDCLLEARQEDESTPDHLPEEPNEQSNPQPAPVPSGGNRIGQRWSFRPLPG